MEEKGKRKSIAEIMKEATERIEAILAVMELGGEGITAEERARRAEQARRAGPPDLMEVEEVNLMGFDCQDPPPQMRMPQEPLNKGRRRRGLPTGKRMTREEQEKFIEFEERRYQQMKAMGHVPADMMLPEVPDEVPDWALGEPEECVGPEPKWPQEFYRTGGRLPAPFFVEPPPEVLQEYDPYHTDSRCQPQQVFSHVEELAPTWDPAPDYYRTRRPAAPRQFIEEFDPYNPYQQPQSPSRRSSPPFPLSAPCPSGAPSTSQSPRSPPAPRSPSPCLPRSSLDDELLPESAFEELEDSQFMLSSRPQSLPRGVTSPAYGRVPQGPSAPQPRSPCPMPRDQDEDDLLPDSLLQEVADPEFMISSRPQSPARAMTSSAQSQRPQRSPSPQGPCPYQSSPQPGPSGGNAQHFVSEVANIVEETRRRLDRTLRSRFGEDLNEALKRSKEL